MKYEEIKIIRKKPVITIDNLLDLFRRPLQLLNRFVNFNINTLILILKFIFYFKNNLNLNLFSMKILKQLQKKNKSGVCGRRLNQTSFIKYVIKYFLK